MPASPVSWRRLKDELGHGSPASGHAAHRRQHAKERVGLRRSVGGDLSVSRNTQRQVLRLPQRKSAHDHLLTWDQLSRISRGLTYARLGIRGAKLCIEQTAS